MTDRFISPEPPPTAYEREVLDILAEEAAEVIQRAMKMDRFGVHETQPGQPLSNRLRLSEEIGDFLAAMELALKANLVCPTTVEEGKRRKHEKLRRFMQTNAS